MGNCQNNCQNKENDVSVTSLFTEKKKHSLIINAYTWNRENCGLFDYETKNLLPHKLNICLSGKLYKKEEKLFYFNETETNKTKNRISHFKLENEPSILSIKNNDDEKYFSISHELVDPCGITAEKLWDQYVFNDNGAWVVVKYFNFNKGYKLSKGDYIKLGRARFKIVEMNFDLKTNKQTLETNNCSFETEIKSGEPSFCCRICLKESFNNISEENPLISPCKCSGSMKFIHLKCLNKWMKSKMNTDNYNCITLLWKNFECELCKTTINPQIHHENKTYDLYELSKPASNYIIFEIYGKKKPQSKGVHILDFNKKKNFKMGRGNDCDIRVTDISVSRTHSNLFFQNNNEVYITDNNSKFGTLILLNKHLKCDERNPKLSLQINKTVIQMNYHTLSSKFNICCQKGKECCMRNKNKTDEKISNIPMYLHDDEQQSLDEIIFFGGIPHNHQMEIPNVDSENVMISSE